MYFRIAIISLIPQLNVPTQLIIFIVYKISPAIEFIYFLLKFSELNICMFTKYLIYFVNNANIQCI